MKLVCLVLAMVLALLAAGCAAPSPGAPATVHEKNVTGLPPPDLIGTWSGTMEGYDRAIGFNPHTGGIMVLAVTGQHGRVFAGNLMVMEGNATLASERFAGIIGRDGRTMVIVEETGSCTGEIIGTDEMELVYARNGNDFAISIDSLRRTS